MSRSEFTLKIARLILLIEQERKLGFHTLRPALDYIKRTAEEQNRLFKAGASKLDGYTKRSAHQVGKAADILLFDENGVFLQKWPKDIIKRYHDIWEEWGGNPVISWDVGHFEAGSVSDPQPVTKTVTFWNKVKSVLVG